MSTDAWYAMGQEAEAEARRKAFEGFTVDAADSSTAAADHAILLHCLPAHRGEEVSGDVDRRAGQPGVGAGRQPHARRAGSAGVAARSMRATGDAATDAARRNKPQRQHLVAKLLAQHAVTSQEQLVDLLAAEGVTATQATVSRDLDDLGAIKVRSADGESVYAIPELPEGPAGARRPPPPGVR